MAAQGNKVRELKANKASADVVKAEVAVANKQGGKKEDVEEGEGEGGGGGGGGGAGEQGSRSRRRKRKEEERPGTSAHERRREGRSLRDHRMDRKSMTS